MRLFRLACGTAAALVAINGALAQSPAPPLARPAIEPALRNPVELNRPVPPPRLQPALEAPPLQPQTGPGAVAEIAVGAVQITGAAAVPPEALAPAIAGLAETTIPLARIEEARLGILRAYREAGYPFAAVNAGVTRQAGPTPVADLNFVVTEGFVAEVKLEGDIGPAGTQVLRFLNRLIGQRPVSAGRPESASGCPYCSNSQRAISG